MKITKTILIAIMAIISWGSTGCVNIPKQTLAQPWVYITTTNEGAEYYYDSSNIKVSGNITTVTTRFIANQEIRFGRRNCWSGKVDFKFDKNAYTSALGDYLLFNQQGSLQYDSIANQGFFKPVELFFPIKPKSIDKAIFDKAVN
ncbi:MAG: hypothetical protein R8M14_04545 [Ghiorsea sp.]